MVYGGTQVTAQAFHQFVTLFTHAVGGGTYLCGGTLINPTTVITAAHCLVTRPLEAITVVSADEVYMVTTGAYSANPLYNPYADDRWQFDTGIVRLPQRLPLKITYTPDARGAWTALPDDSPLFVVGRGLICGSGGPECEGRTIRLGQLNKVSRKRCLGEEDWQWPAEFLGSGTICAGGGKNNPTPLACPGDSGGPLFDGSSMVYGAVSAGDVSNGICGTTLRPGLFASFYFNSKFLFPNSSALFIENMSPPPRSAAPRRRVFLLLPLVVLFFL